MEKLKYILISFFLLIFAGCSNSQIDFNNESIPINNTDLLKGENKQLVTITNNHYLNQNGKVYSLSQEMTLSSGQEVYFMGCTQNKNIHFTSFDIIVDTAPVNIYFYENPNVTNNGTQINSTIMNRNFNYNSTLNLFYNPTISSEGELLFVNGILGDKNQVQSNFGQTEEWVLNLNTCYTFKIINNNGNDNDIIANLIYYEES